MNVGGVNSFLRNDGSAAMQTASIGGENSKFADLLESIRAESESHIFPCLDPTLAPDAYSIIHPSSQYTIL